MSPHRPKVIYNLLTDIIGELDSIKQRLERVAELLIEVRGRDGGLDMRSDDERHAAEMADEFGPEDVD